MKSFIDTNKRKVLAFARATAKRNNLPLPEETDIIEDNGIFYIDLNLPSNAKLPKVLNNNIIKEELKSAKLAELKKKVKETPGKPNKAK